MTKPSLPKPWAIQSQLPQDFQKWIALHKNGMFPPALLLLGCPSAMAMDFLLCFAAIFYCDKGESCGSCPPCLSLAHHRHPDLYVVERGGAVIKREDMDGLHKHLQIFARSTATGAGIRMAAIMEGDRMNLTAANGLLKILEEPPEGALIVILSQRESALLPTIRSRCVPWRVHLPEEGYFQESSPLKALCQKLVQGHSPQQVLQIAEEIGALKPTPFHLAAHIEYALNQLYRSGQPSPGVFQLHKRRRLLRELWRHGSKVPLNVQMAAEHIGLVSLGKR